MWHCSCWQSLVAAQMGGGRAHPPRTQARARFTHTFVLVSNAARDVSISRFLVRLCQPQAGRCARARRVVSPSAFGTCFQHSLLVCLAVSGEELGIDRRYEFRVIGVSCLASLLRRVLKPVGEEGSPTKGTLFFSTPRVWALYFRQKQAQKGAQKTVLKKRACTVCVCVCGVCRSRGAAAAEKERTATTPPLDCKTHTHARRRPPARQNSPTL